MAVFKRKEIWWIDYYHEGNRQREKIGPRKKDAEEALSKIKVQMATGEFILQKERKRQETLKPDAISFKDFAVDDFLPWSAMQHSPGHHIRVKSVIDQHLISFFGSCQLGEITTKQIEDYRRQRGHANYLRGKTAKPVTQATINRELCAIKGILRKAVEWDRLEDSPASKVKTVKETPKPPRLLEQEEIAALLAELPDHLKALAGCAVYAGLRRSELFHLRWSDINRQKNELNVVSRDMHRTKNKEHRRIPINRALEQLLSRHPRHLNSVYVFCNHKGEIYNNVSRR
jgi:hypothetical protein